MVLSELAWESHRIRRHATGATRAMAPMRSFECRQGLLSNDEVHRFDAGAMNS